MYAEIGNWVDMGSRISEKGSERAYGCAVIWTSSGEKLDMWWPANSFGWWGQYNFQTDGQNLFLLIGSKKELKSSGLSIRLLETAIAECMYKHLGYHGIIFYETFLPYKNADRSYW